MKPVEGARKGGAKGFGKGIAKGLTGLVFKPVTGVVDLASNTLQGIANTTDYLDRSNLPPIERRRLPRFLRKGEPMQSYSNRTALQQSILWELGAHGLDDEQKSGVSAIELIDIRERERIMFVSLIEGGEVAVLGTNLRLVVFHIIKRKVIDEYTDEEFLPRVTNVVEAYFGLPGLKPHSKNPKDRLKMQQNSMNATEVVKEHFDSNAERINIKDLQPMYDKIGDPAPGRKKRLYVFYVPSTMATKKDKFKEDLFGNLKMKKKGLKLLLSTRVIFSCKLEAQSGIVHILTYDYANASNLDLVKVVQSDKDLDVDFFSFPSPTHQNAIT